FTIDRTLPVVSGVAEGQKYTAPVTIAFNEGTATLNGASVASGHRITTSGAYTLVVTDAALNRIEIRFELEVAPPPPPVPPPPSGGTGS
ncbi:MAG: hypothetical protein ACRC5C_15585, partial [Bacilli bacterium]